MLLCAEHGTEHGLVRVTDEHIDRLLEAERAALIVVGKECTWCAEYLAGVEIAQALGDLPGLSIGVLVIDEPGAERFVDANQWLADAEGMPYTALYREGLRVDGWVAFNVFSLIDRLEYLGFLSTPQRAPALASARIAA